MPKMRANMKQDGKAWTRDPESKRNRIVEAAIKLYAEKGMEGTTIRDISEEAGENMGLVYYYFDDKADLFNAAIVEAVMGALGGVMAAEARDKGDATERLENIFNAYLKLVDEEPEVATIGIRALLQFMEEGVEPFGGIMVERIGSVVKALTDGQNNGEFAPLNPLVFGFAFISIVYSYYFANKTIESVSELGLQQMPKKDFLKFFQAVLKGMRGAG